jgi:hypothetical protein
MINTQKKLNLVLAEIGSAENPDAPTFIGGCEIENRVRRFSQTTQTDRKEYGEGARKRTAYRTFLSR